MKAYIIHRKAFWAVALTLWIATVVVWYELGGFGYGNTTSNVFGLIMCVLFAIGIVAYCVIIRKHAIAKSVILAVVVSVIVLHLFGKMVFISNGWKNYIGELCNQISRFDSNQEKFRALGKLMDWRYRHWNIPDSCRQLENEINHPDPNDTGKSLGPSE